MAKPSTARKKRASKKAAPKKAPSPSRRRSYSWKSPLLAKKAKASVIGKELTRIESLEGGMLQADTLVEYAQDEGSPLYALFTWDDTAAARKYRLIEARRILTSITVTVTERGEQRNERIYVHAPKTKTTPGGYVKIDLLNPGDERIGHILARARKQLLAWRDRYNELRERLPDAFASVDIALNEFNDLDEN